MSTSWVAGSVRARALAHDALAGTAGHAAFRAGSLRAAVAVLQESPYGSGLGADDDLTTAQHAVSATLLWRLRVLAGWVPPEGAQLLRALAAGFELANTDEHVARLEGRPHGPTYLLGSLETAWARLARTRSLEELREALIASPWRDPGGSTAWEVHTAMVLTWAERVAAVPVDAAAAWARGGAALVLLRESLVVRRPLPDAVRNRAQRLLGTAATAAMTDPTMSLAEVTDTLPRSLHGLFSQADGPEDLWRAEMAWRRRVAEDAASLLRRAAYGPETVVAAVGALAADTWRVRAGLELAARGAAAGASGGAGPPVEVLDALG